MESQSDLESFGLNFSFEIQENIMSNGVRLSKNDVIRDLKITPTNNIIKITATIRSESDDSLSYYVAFKLINKKFCSQYCDCPYFEENEEYCKHLIALLIHILEGNLINLEKKNTKEIINLIDENQKTNFFDSNSHVNNEIECQICLEIMKKPVFLPCFMHSICFECYSKVFDSKKENSTSKKKVIMFCPTCNENAGILKIADLSEIKFNKELERVITAYQKEKKEENELNADEKIENIYKILEKKNQNDLEKIIEKCLEEIEKKVEEKKIIHIEEDNDTYEEEDIKNLLDTIAKKKKPIKNKKRKMDFEDKTKNKKLKRLKKNFTS